MAARCRAAGVGIIDMVELVGNLKTAMADRIEHNGWMSEPTKKAALEKAMAGHIVAEGSLMGTYSHEK